MGKTDESCTKAAGKYYIQNHSKKHGKKRWKIGNKDLNPNCPSGSVNDQAKRPENQNLLKKKKKRRKKRKRKKKRNKSFIMHTASSSYKTRRKKLTSTVENNNVIKENSIFIIGHFCSC